MKKYSQLESAKYIPLNPYTKIASEKWGTDKELNISENQKSYAIDTGRSNLVIIDCDNKNTINGVNSFLEQAQTNDSIPQTFTVKTPNDGLHFYFKSPSNYKIKSSNGTVLGPGIDIRAYGGYIVAPGSLLRVENDIREYTVEDDELEIAELPSWILQKIKNYYCNNHNNNANDKKNKNNQNNKNNTGISEKEELDRKAALDWAVRKMAGAVEGQRETTLNNLCYFLGRKRVNEKKARELVDIAIDKGLSNKEANNKFEHSYNDGLQQKELSYDVMVKEYNAKNNISIKEDPLDTGFYTHVSLSYNFWKLNKDKYLYYIHNMNWYEYNENKGYWKEIGEQLIKTKVKEYLEDLVDTIRSKNKNIRPNVYSLQEKMWAKSTIDAVSIVARSDFLNQNENLFDNDPFLINCKNGVFDLKKETLYPHSSKYYLTKYIPINYLTDAHDDYCEAIIDSIHPDEKDYVQLIAGQSLTGYQPSYQAAYFLHGRGSNGKSTFVDLMLKTSGSYGKLQPPNIFSPDKNNDTYALADFEGLRTAIIEELPDSKHLNAGSLKRLVGTRKINARAIYSKNREFDNESTIFITCNRLPMINETDDGTWRRLLVFTFPYSYKKSKLELKNEWDRLGNPQVIYAAQNKRTTAEAFLKWRIDGAIKWINNPKIEYIIPLHIENTINEWNENNDLFLAWFNETITVKANYFITINDLLNSFNEWLTKRNNSAVSARYFHETLKNHKIYYNNNLVLKSKARVLKNMIQSNVVNNNTYSNNIHYSPGDKCTYVSGIKFK